MAREPLAFPLFARLEARMSTFFWWNRPGSLVRNASFDPHLLCDAGFFYTNVNSVCVCHFCGLEESNFPLDADPLASHLERVPGCADLRKQWSTVVRMPARADFDAVYPSMSEESKRWLSYSKFPIQVTQEVRELVRSGLFYSGLSDMLICFHCGCRLETWQSDDVAHKRHLTENPYCVFGRIAMEYVNE